MVAMVAMAGTLFCVATETTGRSSICDISDTFSPGMVRVAPGRNDPARRGRAASLKFLAERSPTMLIPVNIFATSLIMIRRWCYLRVDEAGWETSISRRQPIRRLVMPSRVNPTRSAG